MIKVINIKDDSNACEYCGRGSIFGSPYEIGRDGNREECLRKYKKWFNFLLRDKRFVNELMKLKGKTLGCFCKPKDCHCDIIKEYLDSLDKLVTNDF